MYPKWHCTHKELKMMNYLFIPGYLTQTINIIVLLILKYLYSTLFIFRQTTDKTTTQMKLKILRTKILWYVKTILICDMIWKGWNLVKVSKPQRAANSTKNVMQKDRKLHVAVTFLTLFFKKYWYYFNFIMLPRYFFYNLVAIFFVNVYADWYLNLLRGF